MRRLEAVLFLAREPLSSRKLAQHADLHDGTEARTLIREINRTYDQAGRAFRAEEVAGGYQLLTRRVFAPWLRRLEHIPREIRLSPPAMETLAVVAYRQPVLRAEIEAIRGVSSGEILRQLMERDLVRIGGRSEDLGRPYLYTTTKHFLEVFGFRNLDQLPRADSFDAVATPVVPSSPSELVTDEAQAGQESGEMEESDVTVTLPNEVEPEPQLPTDEFVDREQPVAENEDDDDADADADTDTDSDADDEEYDDWDDDDDDDDDADSDSDDDDDDDFDDDDDDDGEYDEDWDDDADDLEDDEWEEVDDDDDDTDVDDDDDDDDEEEDWGDDDEDAADEEEEEEEEEDEWD